jgi:hypothetical protein
MLVRRPAETPVVTALVGRLVVTNPPFSLFREYVEQLIKYKKKFLAREWRGYAQSLCC